MSRRGLILLVLFFLCFLFVLNIGYSSFLTPEPVLFYLFIFSIFVLFYLFINKKQAVEKINLRLLRKKKKHYPVLQKFEQNPIIKPAAENCWESKATFNTAAVYARGQVHFVYRAMGNQDISILGYASSKDGLNIDERLIEPVYIPKEPFELPPQNPSLEYQFNQAYVSGGGYGGCEDPRITKIEDKLYMTYVAYNGCNHPRVALTSIKTDDFFAKRWDWEKPILISEPGVVNKNACLFPEKINGQYVILHRVFPNILIDFVDTLDFNQEKYLETKSMIKIRPQNWDSRKIGAGSPPIKTKDGWLLIYNAVDDRDAGRYKIGAMLLDLKNPDRILCRPDKPILEPTENYENEGFKSGVVYSCGAVIVKDQLIVYYGGADTVVCAAKADLNEFLENLKYSKYNYKFIH